MVISALNDSQDQSATHEVLLEFPDNRLLIDLCGEYDRNLADIEQKLGVQIVRRGNQLSVMGEDSAREQAAGVLTALYDRLETGRSVETGDIDRELRMNPEAESAEPDGQLQMFRGGRVEIKTRKKLVEPRTEAQKAYVHSLFENELAFGIGPAGTGKTYLAVAVGVSMMAGVKELRVKESDRIDAMAKGLRANGVTVEEGEDWWEVTGLGIDGVPGGGICESVLDHRIAMP